VLVRTRASLISAGTERSMVELARKNLLEKARERPELVKKVIDRARREGVLSTFEAVRTKLDSPVPLGYSLCGVVEEVGRGLREFARGERVACAGAGVANHAELNAVPKNLAVRVPDEVSDEEASFATVGAIALHGVRLLKPELGATIAVIGLGLLGQIAVSLLTAHGCDVIGIDLDQAKVDRALSRGAVAGIRLGDGDPIERVRAATDGLFADGVLVTASSSTAAPVELAGEIARDRARVSLVGLFPVHAPRKLYFEKELRLVVSRSTGPGRYDASYEEHGHDYPAGYVRWTERRNLSAVLRAIATGRLDVKSLITHRFPFERALDAYTMITAEDAPPHLGVVLEYPKATESDVAGRNGAGAAREARTPVQPVRREKLGVAVVGTGAFATSTLLPALAALPRARLVATVSGRGLSAAHAAEKYGVPRVLPALDDVLADDSIDAVVIATRHGAHASQAARVLASGRSVFLEKPAAIDAQQLQMLGAAVRDARGGLLVGFNRRFSPQGRAVKAAFAGRQSPLVMTARVNAGHVPRGAWLLDPTDGGGRIVGEGCHFIDLMAYWAGADAVSVSAHAAGPAQGEERADNILATVSFADGSVGTLVYTSVGDPSVSKERYEVFGEGTVAILDGFRRLDITRQGKTRTTRALKVDKGHGQELEDFVAAALEGRPMPIAWASIEATTRATFAIEAAWRHGATIDLADPEEVREAPARPAEGPTSVTAHSAN
jgi:predicted dehydrogenase/threonine dehydrogenase-like Zn-dependent dehydrogenase